MTRSSIRLAVVLCVCAIAVALDAQPYSFRHHAGYPGGRAYADGQTPQDARFNVARGLSVSPDGILYAGDTVNGFVRRVEADGTVSTLFGNGGTTTVPGTGSAGSFGNPRVTAVGPDGMIYVANATEVVKLTPAGTMSLFVGGATAGSADGVGAAAQFTSIWGMAADRFGNVYVADGQLHNIRKIVPNGTVTTLAGLANSSGAADGTGTSARFSGPSSLAVGLDDNIYVADTSNKLIRRVTPAGVVTTVAGSTSGGFVDGQGTAARFWYPIGITVDATGNFFIADLQSNAVRKMTPTFAVTTVVGGGPLAGGVIDGANPTARLNQPFSVAAAPNGDVWVVGLDEALRRITGNVITTITSVPWGNLGVDGTGPAARFGNPHFVLADSAGNVYVTSGGACLRMISPTGVVTTVAGSCTVAGLTNANGTSARFRNLYGMRFGADGNLYLVDAGNSAIRMMTPSGDVTTWATGTLSGARDIVFDSSGNAYVTDTSSHVIRRIDGITKAITTFAGTVGSQGDTNGTGSAARFREPWGIAIDGAGTLYVSELQGYRIRKVTTPGAVVSSFVGTNSAGCIDGTGTGARFSYPRGLAWGPNGDLYVAQEWSSIIRRVNVTTGVVTTIAGKCDQPGAQDGIGTAALFYSPYSVTFDPSGRLYVADFFNFCVRVGLPLIDDLATIDAPTGTTGLPRQLDTAPQTATSWTWNVIRRPGGSRTTISDPSIRNPTVTPDVDDVFTFELTAEGGALGRISTAQVTASCTTPAAPTITSSSPNPSCAGSKVTLEASTGYTSYLWSNGARSRVIHVYPSSQTSYTVRGLIGTCMSDPSTEYTQTVYTPDAPANPAATPTAANRITVSWTAPAWAVDHYNVYRALKSCGSGMPYTKIGTSMTTSFDDNTVSPGETYSYQVTAATAGDSCESATSACDDATAYGDCPTDPTFAGLASVTSNNCLLRLAWSAATSNCLTAPAIVYNIYRSTSSSFTPSAANRIARCVTTTFFDDINAPAGTNYYVVRAEDSSAGNGGACNGGNEETNVVRRSGTMSAPVGTTTQYRDDFDSTRPAANPNAYWKETITAPAGNDQIAFSTCRTGEAGTTYKFGPVGICSGTYAASSNQWLELGGDGTVDPAINGFVLPSSGTVRLRFRHSWVFESTWDGAALYYKTSPAGSWTHIGESVSAFAPYLTQGLYTGTASSAGGTRVWTGNQSLSFLETIVNLDAIRGQTVWFAWRFTSDSVFHYDGYHLDDVILETLVPLTCDITGPVQAFTVTARDGMNKLEWLNPASTHYATTILRYRTDGVLPTSSTDGLPVGAGTETGASDTYDFAEHTVTNGTAYRYAAFVQASNGLIGPARAAAGRAEPVAATKWIYNTGASAMTPPGIASIFAVSNDRILHSINQGTTGGDWASGWRPFAMNGPSQARPSVVAMNNHRINGAPKVAFIGSQDGYVYAVNAATGAELWGTQIGQMVQSAPSVALREYGIGLTNVDLIVAGTRNSTPPNGVYALNTQGGAVAWSYTGGGTYTIGVIGSQVSIDYATRRIYFASRAASSSTNQNHTVWCLTFDDTTATRLWSVPLGDIEGSPVLRNGTLYVGTNNGIVYALNPNDGSTLASFATNDGPVKSYPFPNVDGRLYFSTTNRVWSLTDSLSAPRSLTLNWSVTSIPAPSTAVLARNALYVGSSNGRLYKISQLTDPTPAIGFTQLGTGLAAVGTIGYDYQNDLAYVGTAEGAIYAVVVP